MDGSQICTDGKTNQYGPCAGATLTPTTYFKDVDGDGYGSSASTSTCGARPAGYSNNTGDCCDEATDLALAGKIHPGQTEYFKDPANLCGVTWNYDCSGSIETSPALLPAGCDANTTFPTCSTNYVPVRESDCGKTISESVCDPVTDLERCQGFGGPATIKCH
jgi:hypothetical protein